MSLKDYDRNRDAEKWEGTNFKQQIGVRFLPALPHVSSVFVEMG